MRNNNERWNAPNTESLVWKSDRIEVLQITLGRQTLVSGSNVLANSKLPLIGWPGDAPNDAYALILRRDRILEVNGMQRTDGWDDENDLAVSDMSAGYTVFEICGDQSLDFFKHGGFVEPDKPSRSVSRLLLGTPSLLYRRSDGVFRLHIRAFDAQSTRRRILSHLTT